MSMPVIPDMPPLWESASDGLPSRAMESTSELATRLVVTMAFSQSARRERVERFQGTEIGYAVSGPRTRRRSSWGSRCKNGADLSAPFLLQLLSVRRARLARQRPGDSKAESCVVG